MARSVARTVFLITVWLFAACCVLQVFLAGRGVFDTSAGFEAHRDFGYTFGFLLLVILISAIVGRMGRVYIGGAVLLMVLFTLQSVFVAFRTDMPSVAALHPLNGFLILLTTLILGRAAWKDRHAAAVVAPTTSTPAPTAATTSAPTPTTDEAPSPPQA